MKVARRSEPAKHRSNIQNNMKTTYARVSYLFARKIDTNLIAFSKNVIALMQTNVGLFKTPVPDLVTVTNATNALEVAVQEALEGGKIAVATRNAARAELLSLSAATRGLRAERLQG